MKETQLDGESLDIVSDNVSKLKEIFPEVITEDKIDFDKLKLILGSDIDTDSERYSFTWPGKTQAIKESQKQSTGTLRPCKEESKNWDTTKNLYIEGDNLEVLKLLQKGYYNKVKMIYIDPPYNTGNDFIYPDNYQDNLNNYLEISGQVSESEGVKLTTNTETSGRYHTNWLNMMYPRLKLARNLLTDDGVIFISIDENELSNLRNILNEIFGEDNYLTTITIKQRHENRILKGDKDFHEVTEFCLVYKKGINYKQYKRKKDNSSINDYIYSIKELKEPDEIIEMGNKMVEVFSPDSYLIEKNEPSSDLFKKISIRGSLKEGNSSGRFYMKYLNSITDKYDWLYKVPDMGSDKVPYRYFLKPPSEKIVNGSYFQGVPQDKKDFIEIPYPNFLDLVDVFNNVGYEGEIPFRNGKKPIDFLNHLFILAGLEENSEAIVLDFFSGSASLGHALMNFNSKDNGRRKFILIQIPEPCAEKDEAYSKYNLNNICEIGKERLRRSGQKIIAEQPIEDLDTGFKVFKLDSSNLEKWSPNYNDLEQTLLVAQDNIKADRTKEDLIYEIMLKYGIDLTLPIKKYESGENTVYSIGFGALLICLDNKITKNITDTIVELSKETEITRVVFKDNGFASDSDKTNIKETLRTHNIDEFITI